jgi:AraC family transcriptional regulator
MALWVRLQHGLDDPMKTAKAVKHGPRATARLTLMKPDTRSFYELAVQRAVEQVVADLDRALDLQALARRAALSPFHFHRVFRGAVGETPLELHRRLRMERAAGNLLHEDIPVTTIAFAAGYETHESFTRAFRMHYQCSPSEFRQSRHPDGSGCAKPFQVELSARSGIHFQLQRSEPPNIHFMQGEPIMEIEIKEMPELRVATMPHLGPYHRISEAFARLGEIAAAAGLLDPAPTMLAIYHDDPETTPASELRSDAAIVVSPDAKVPQGLGEQRLSAGLYACTTHVGPYEQLGDVWGRFMGEWLPRSNHRMKDGVSYEIYRNTPATAPKEKLRTELYIPLA